MKRIHYVLATFLLILLIGLMSGCSSKISGNVVKEINANGDLQHLVLEINGMYCAACGPGIAKMISEADGVLIAKVSRAKERGEVIYDPAQISKEEISGLLHDPYSTKILADMPATSQMVDNVKNLKND